jgi:NADH-quinone oxidoreductase subunit N
LLVGEAHPFIAGFVLSMLSTVALLNLVNFLDGFSWLRTYPLVPQALRLLGIVMVATGGFWAAFQQDLSRLFGYSVIMESGFALIGLSLGTQAGLETFAFLFMPRTVAFAIWGLSLSIFKQKGLPLTFNGVQGAMRRLPFNSFVLSAAILTLGGLPVLALFPARQVLLEGLAKQSISQAFWVLAGSLAFLVSGFRTLVILAQSNQSGWKIEESWFQILLLVGGILILIIIGLFPTWFSPTMLNLLQSFQNLK